MKVYKSESSKSKILATYDKLLKEWDIPVSETKVPTRYGITHVNVFGRQAGEPLVLFHGVGEDSALMWIYNAKALAEHFKLYAVDTIGGPGKSIPNENYNKQFDDIVWIDEILDYFDLKRIHIAGVSHGGYLAQYYTLMRPKRVKKALALASSVPVSFGGSPMKTMIKIFFPEALIPTKKNVIKLLVKLSGKNHSVFTENALIAQHYTYLLRGFNNMAMGYHKVIRFNDAQVELIKEKCLYIVGDADPFAIMGGKAMLQKYNMNAIFYPEAGHGINHEISDKINNFMIQYFSY